METYSISQSIRSIFTFIDSINAFIQQGRITFIKSDSEELTMLLNTSILNKCCSLKLSIQTKNPDKMHHKFHTTVFNIDYNKKYLLSSKSVY